MPYNMSLNMTGNLTDVTNIISTANSSSGGLFLNGMMFAFFVILFSWIYDGTVGKALFGSALATTLFVGILYYLGLASLALVSFFTLLTAVGLVVMVNE